MVLLYRLATPVENKLWGLGGSESIAYDINDLGQVVGESTYNGRTQPNAFLYSPNPVPIPSTLLLLGSGLIGLWGVRRKMKK